MDRTIVTSKNYNNHFTYISLTTVCSYQILKPRKAARQEKTARHEVIKSCTY